MKSTAQRNNSAGPAITAVSGPLLRALPPVVEDMVKPQTSPEGWLETRIVNPLIESDWDKWIDPHPEANVFHSSAWARVIVETYNHEPCYLRICAQGELVALIPVFEVQSLLTKRRGVCLPFSDYCSPLLFNDFSKAGVLTKLRQVARERSWRYFEVRDATIIPEQATPFESYYGHRLDLRPGPDPLFARLASSTQRAIRKAERSGLSATVNSTWDAMRHFYRLHARTRRRHGAPPQSRSFFTSIQRNIINAGLGFTILVRSGGHVVAAAMFFRHKSKALYKFGASDERAQEFRGNNLAIWKAIEFLAQSEVDTLHFGRTDQANEGLRRFKLSWGTTEELIRYFRFDIPANHWVEATRQTRRLHTAVFRALPVAINRLAGAMIYPHLD